MITWRYNLAVVAAEACGPRALSKSGSSNLPESCMRIVCDDIEKQVLLVRGGLLAGHHRIVTDCRCPAVARHLWPTELTLAIRKPAALEESCEPAKLDCAEQRVHRGFRRPGSSRPLPRERPSRATGSESEMAAITWQSTFGAIVFHIRQVTLKRRRSFGNSKEPISPSGALRPRFPTIGSRLASPGIASPFHVDGIQTVVVDQED